MAEPHPTDPNRIIIRCRDCNKRFSRRRRAGKPPVRCKACREAPKPSEVEVTCSKCGSTFTHILSTSGGRTPKRCEDCRQSPVLVSANLIHAAPEIEGPYRKRIAELIDQYGGPHRSIFLVPKEEVEKAQEDLRRAWCAAYGRAGLSERIEA